MIIAGVFLAFCLGVFVGALLDMRNGTESDEYKKGFADGFNAKRKK